MNSKICLYMKRQGFMLLMLCACLHFSCTNHGRDKKGESEDSVLSVMVEYTDPFAVPEGGDTAMIPFVKPIKNRLSMKELAMLNDSLWKRRDFLGRKNPLWFNFHGSAVGADSVTVYLSINTSYWQNVFRKQISFSSFIRFEGPSGPEKIVLETDSGLVEEGVYLRPESTEWPVSSDSVSFILCNHGSRRLQFGASYLVAYQGADKSWYRLPGVGSWEDMAYGLAVGGCDTFTVRLYPVLNRNKPGIYRLYKKVVPSQGDHEGCWLMTEFRLAD